MSFYSQVLWLAKLDLCNNLLALWIVVLLLYLLSDLLGNLKLALVVCKDGTSVLCAAVRALVVQVIGGVCAIVELDESRV